MQNVVVVREAQAAHYGQAAIPAAAPELPGGAARTVAETAIRQLLADWGLDREHYGAASWNPLGEWIAPGMKVVLKPNWVMHRNRSGQGMDCLITHASVIEAVLEYVALARPGSVVVGDAPIQGCDFEVLARECGLAAMQQRIRERHGLEVEIADFRRTILRGNGGRMVREEGARQIGEFVLFDLGRESLLEPLAPDSQKFRVTQYNPDLLLQTHAAARHQYLISAWVMEADVVINLPKLKTHKKACITGALKNLVGINGNKEYLPHHRKGGSGSGGDCYVGSSPLKRLAEDLLDASNRRPPGVLSRLLSRGSELCMSAGRRLGEDLNLEGSWYGNDTIWRTCLDLQRILHYGDLAGNMQPQRQRRVITITDAIVGGQGEGPLANTPAASRFVTAGCNPAALEWIHARLMGLDPMKVPLVRQAFSSFSYPLVDFQPKDIVMRLNGAGEAAHLAGPFPERTFQPPMGWLGHCELEPGVSMEYDSPVPQ